MGKLTAPARGMRHSRRHLAIGPTLAEIPTAASVRVPVSAPSTSWLELAQRGQPSRRGVRASAAYGGDRIHVFDVAKLVIITRLLVGAPGKVQPVRHEQDIISG
jgi:hypothetical protein